MYGFSSINALDEIRIASGYEKLNSHFKKLANSSLKQAVDILNDKNLSYSSLFILKDTIDESNISSNLSIRNKIALDLTDEIINKKSRNSISTFSSTNYIQATNSTLKWMLETGSDNDGYSNEFDKVLDITSILLTKVFKERDVLPTICDLIFKRHKKGFLIHDLLWGYYESQDVNTLILIGEKLKSNDVSDVELACDLLSFIPEINLKHKSNSEYLYLTFINWFEENKSFLHYTGESFQQTSKPKPFKVDINSKYLGKSASINTIYQIQTLNESNKVSNFNNLDENTKSFLANYSSNLRKKDIYNWYSWLNKPIDEQLRIAHTRNGVV